MQVETAYLRGVVAVAATLWLLVQARVVLQPFLIALFIWFIYMAAADLLGRGLARVGLAAPILANLAAGGAILCAMLGFGAMIAAGAGEIAAELPRYEARLDAILEGAAAAVGLDAALSVADLVAKIDLSGAAVRLVGSAAGAVSAIVIIAVYIMFINEEAGAAEAKLAALVAEPDRRAEVESVARGALTEIQRYMAVRVALGVVQAAPTGLVLSLVGVDAPGFWAAIVFFASFIPTIGTMVGILFPTLMALLQFDTAGPFFIVIGTLLPLQLLASNLLEPKLLSRSMNLSPLAVFLGIFAGGAIWGIVGALIVVPLLAICLIVFSRIPSMRPFAILLSGDGRLYGS
jgi:AI-2 transport protein TqsA